MALAAELEDAGHEVIDIAPTGEDALKIITRQAVDLVILDVKLGNGMDGLETLEKIREIKSPYIFIVSGNSDAPTAQRIKALGVDRFFVKPINTISLMEAIKKLGSPNS